MKRITMLLGAGTLLLSSMVYAAVPQLINFQGILRDGSGNPVANGSYSVVFTIYDDPTAGNVLWTETQTVTTTNGLFNAILGSSGPLNTIPDSAFSNTAGGLAHWLGIKVGADPEMTPRQKLVSVGYGYRCEHVNTVDGAAGGSIASPISFGNTATPELYIYESGTSNPTRPIISHSPAFSDWGLAYNDVNDRFVFQSAGNPVLTAHLGFERVGIGILTPQNKFDVSGSATIGAAYAGFNVAPANGLLVEGRTGIGTTAPTARLTVNVPGFNVEKAIYASSSFEDAIYATSGQNAIVGEVNSSSYSGIVGINNGSGYAGYFSGFNGVSGSGGNVGVAGNGGTYGVYGSASSYGVYGTASANGGSGVYGSNGGNASTYAGYFVGTLYVNGTAGNNTGVWSNLSDKRLKKDIEPIQNALETVEQLQPVSFRWKDEKKDAEFGRVRGLIAQDVEKVIPEWIKTDLDGYKRIEPIGVDALLIEAIKELKAENDLLKNRILKLEQNRPQAKVE